MPPEKQRPAMEFKGHGAIWLTPSSSRPSLYHITITNDNGATTCTCEGFRNHKRCWHVEAVADPNADEDFVVSL